MNISPLVRTAGLLLGVSALGGCVLGCTDAVGGAVAPDSPLRLDVRAESGALKVPLYAWWSQEKAPVEAIQCPGGKAQANLACAPTGLELKHPEGSLTLKASGYKFVTTTIDEPKPDSESAVRVKLTALNERQQTANYTTWFASDDSALFESLSVPSQTELGETHSLKFYIQDLDSEPEVFFQDTRRYPRHFDFAHDVLRAAGSPDSFAAATYQGEDRKAMAGTLTWYPNVKLVTPGGEKVEAPYVLSFFSSDDLSPDLVLKAHRLVEERLGLAALSGSRFRLLYVPAGEEQLQAAEHQLESFAARGVPWARAGDLYASVPQQLLNPGVAFGTLRLLGPDAVATSVLSFRDILVLPQLPNDLPLVGGTVTAEPQTPLAHVNLLAHSRGTPNLSLKDAPEDERIAPYLDTLVRFEVTATGFSITPATSTEAEAFWTSRAPPLFTPDADLEFTGLPHFEDLHFADAIRVGSKAANLGELRQLLGEAAPPGFAVPFSAYREHLVSNHVTEELCVAALTACNKSGSEPSACDWASDQCQQASQAELSLEGYLAELLDNDAFTADTLLRDAALHGLRRLIETSPVPEALGIELDAQVAELVGTGKVKLRSSTNVEDLASFSGAGLYESYRARATGDERASSVVRRVWSSAWTFDAFEERAWWNVEQSHIAMGVAVNPAISDEEANGVLITGGISPCASGQTYVNVQVGEVSVTNPTGYSVPEAYCVVPGADGGVQAQILGYSSFSPDSAILSPSEVRQLEETCREVIRHFAPLYGTAPSATYLDMEFKFHGEERALLIKQVRPFSVAHGS